MYRSSQLWYGHDDREECDVKVVFKKNRPVAISVVERPKQIRGTLPTNKPTKKRKPKKQTGTNKNLVVPDWLVAERRPLSSTNSYRRHRAKEQGATGYWKIVPRGISEISIWVIFGNDDTDDLMEEDEIYAAREAWIRADRQNLIESTMAPARKKPARKKRKSSKKKQSAADEIRKAENTFRWNDDSTAPAKKPTKKKPAKKKPAKKKPAKKKPAKKKPAKKKPAKKKTSLEKIAEHRAKIAKKKFTNLLLDKLLDRN